MEEKQAKELARAKQQAAQTIEQLKSQSQQLMGQLEELLAQKESENFAQMVSQVKVNYNTSLKRMEQLADPVTKKSKLQYTLPRALKPGDRVIVDDLNLEGTVVSKPDGAGMVTIQSGILKSKVKLESLRLVEDSQQVTVNNQRVRVNNKTASRQHANIKTELDIRGMAADDGILEVDRFLDAAVMSGLQTVSIIHGKGTGILRSAVQQHLRRHKSVRTFRLGTYGEGESGVTIVELK